MSDYWYAVSLGFAFCMFVLGLLGVVASVGISALGLEDGERRWLALGIVCGLVSMTVMVLSGAYVAVDR